MDEPTERNEAWTHPSRYVTAHEWREEVLVTLKALAAGLTVLVAEQRRLTDLLWRLIERPDPHVEKEPAAVIGDPHAEEEPLGTWILTDETVSRIEEAVEMEQRVRGRAYGA